jgi:hypothetical protein
MELTDHRLERIHQGNQRYRCSRCEQSWTSKPASRCPGVPVVSGQEPHFKTMTALKAERKYLDWERPHAAYRTRNAPYYGFLYDERKAIQIPLTAEQAAANEKRQETMRARYGCRICTRHYTPKKRRHFRDGVCPNCYEKVDAYNRLITWSRQMIEARALLLDFFTLPPERPVTDYGQAPPAYRNDVLGFFRLDNYRLTGYAALDLVDGEIRYGTPAIRESRDLADLRYLLLAPADGTPLAGLATSPVVVAPGHFVVEIARRALAPTAAAARDLLLSQARDYFPRGYNYHARTPNTPTGWTRILADQQPLTERELLAAACDACGIVQERAFESSAVLMRRLILYWTALEPIHIDPAAKAVELDDEEEDE